MSQSRLYPLRPILAASCAVFRDGKVLLAARANRPAQALPAQALPAQALPAQALPAEALPPAKALFSLPGGLVEPGERLQEAALRELDEEVGVRAAIAGFAGHVEVIERDERGIRRHFVVAAFAARWLSGEATTGPEASAVIWTSPAAIATLDTTDGLADIVAAAARIVAGE